MNGIKDGIVAYEVGEAIRRAKSRYCRFVDTKQWEAFERLALPDAPFTFRDVAGEIIQQFASPREMVAASRPLLAGARSLHRVSNSELTWRDDNTVAAIWAMTDRIVFPARDGQGDVSLRGAGHYHELWTRAGDGWRLAELELQRTFLELGPDATATSGAVSLFD
ncbi:nuclear transport factor 2 family protein [Phenylobacterium koreense]|uniref:SnoaL-like domain-containing protein n=1 Tax=Phenylobacterium koreense TaxID=266125 RepID=A0ABV2ENK6_9CAUL